MGPSGEWDRYTYWQGNVYSCISANSGCRRAKKKDYDSSAVSVPPLRLYASDEAAYYGCFGGVNSIHRFCAGSVAPEEIYLSVRDNYEMDIVSLQHCIRSRLISSALAIGSSKYSYCHMY